MRALFTALLIVALFCAASVAAQEARTVEATMYNDGHSCPGGCDAHVVFQKSMNGTPNAFLPPLANRDAARDHACVSGQPCMICFDETDASCITVLYRGSGPPDGKFDFTPAFFDAWCPKSTKPAALESECGRIGDAERSYSSRINCFATPDADACAAVMTAAAAAQAADAPEYLLCEELGVTAYNQQQSDTSRHRSTRAGCGYSENTRKENSRGVKWQVLLPGACAAGSFVGRDGLDCCSSTLAVAAYLHPECTPYYPKP